MDYKKAIIIANRTSEGISVIDIHICDDKGRILLRPSKGVIDKINSLPLLDRTRVQSVISRQYGIPQNCVIFK